MINRIIDICAHNKFLVFLFIGMAVLFGWHSLKNTKLDAIPDLSDTQVIVYGKWDRSPDIMEDQVTYPITSALLGMPKVKDIRGFSDFGYSYVYIIFEEGTDIYWARSRTLEYLNSVIPRLPKGVSVELAKDATAVGWVYQYALVDTSGQYSIEKMRSYQDWYLRYALQSVPGVAEVAPLGGFVRQYQVNVDPNKLLGYKIPINMVVEAIQKSNNDVGARLVEMSGREYMVRGRGYIKSLDDIGNVVVMSNPQTGTPVLVKDLATVTYGPDIRRGVGELDGQGETVGGVVIMRFGENAQKVIERVKQRIKDIEPTLPKGLKIVNTYDRSDLIDRSVDNLKHTLMEELIIVSIVIMVFLWHFPSAIIPIITIPVTVILAFIPIQMSGMTANIMSLGGIAIAIGAMIDAAVVVVEQTHKKLEHWDAEGRPGSYKDVVISAVKEVGGPSFFALLVIAVAFLPVFTLEAQEGRLFKPLAFTKNFAMAIAAVLAITLDPAMRLLFTRMDNFNFRPRWLARIVNAVLVGKIHSEDNHPVSRPLMKLYHPVVEFVLEHKWKTIAAAVIAMALTVPVFFKLGSEFMPPLDEGTLLYMPTTLPGMSVTEASRLLQVQDKIIKSFPEVERVFGKAGRVESVPRWIVEGYGTLLAEVDEQFAEHDLPGPDLVSVPVGVGSLAQAVVTHYRRGGRIPDGAGGGRGLDRAPAVLAVEPETAAGVLTSLRAEARRSVPTAETVMAGLNCGTPSSLAWPVLAGGLDAAIAVADQQATEAGADLGRLGVRSGPSGAASLAGVRAALTGPGAGARRAGLGVTASSVVLLLSTEGTGRNGGT